MWRVGAGGRDGRGGTGGEGLGGSRREMKSGGEGFKKDNLFSFEVKIYLYGNRRTKTYKHSYVKKSDILKQKHAFKIFFKNLFLTYKYAYFLYERT